MVWTFWRWAEVTGEGCQSHLETPEVSAPRSQAQPCANSGDLFQAEVPSCLLLAGRGRGRGTPAPCLPGKCLDRQPQDTYFPSVSAPPTPARAHPQNLTGGWGRLPLCPLAPLLPPRRAEKAGQDGRWRTEFTLTLRREKTLEQQVTRADSKMLCKKEVTKD